MKRKQNLGPLQEEWLRCLESGEFKQTDRALCEASGESEECGHCCLGVAIVVAEVNGVSMKARWNANGEMWEWDGEAYLLPIAVRKAMKFRGTLGELEDEQIGSYQDLAHANDNGLTFAEIAAFVREHPEAVFEGPA